MEYYDWIVLGGGAAGLSLVNAMIDRGLGGRILLLEKSKKSENDRTWCYWSKEPLPNVGGSDSVWNQGLIATKKSQKKFSLKHHNYRMIRSSGFYQQSYRRFEQHPSVEVAYESVEKIERQGDRVLVQTEFGSYYGAYVFNSLLPFSPASINRQWGLKQHFLGWWIESPTPIFDSECMRMMDFRVPQSGEVQFVYVLPLSPHKALIEYTVFSQQAWKLNRYRQGIRRYLKQQYQLRDFEITEEEKGIIPMSTAVFPRITDERIIHIGTAGGMTKASTGYTFHRIQEDSQQLVKSFQENGRLIPSLMGTGRFAFYDHLLLWLIQHEPDLVPDIMMRLFSSNSADLVLKFLHEKTHLLQELLIFCRLHWPPFLKALRYAYLKTSTKEPLGSMAQPSQFDLPIR
ncbi:MAG: lycopene cyclase family protein [Bacteroidota bacterium]